jgi:hypothetical protein
MLDLREKANKAPVKFVSRSEFSALSVDVSRLRQKVEKNLAK